VFTIIKVKPSAIDVEYGLTELYTIVDSNGEARDTYYSRADASREFNRLSSKCESFEALRSYDEGFAHYGMPF